MSPEIVVQYQLEVQPTGRQGTSIKLSADRRNGLTRE